MAYLSQAYAKAVVMRSAVLHIPYATCSREGNGDIIIFAQFEEGGLLSGTRDDTEISDEYDDNSTLAPLISEE